MGSIASYSASLKLVYRGSSEEYLGSIEKDLYYENDNTFTERIKLTQEQINDLALGKCYLVLEGDGDIG